MMHHIIILISLALSKSEILSLSHSLQFCHFDGSGVLKITATDTFECWVVSNLKFDDLMSFILPLLHSTIVYHKSQVFPIYNTL